MAIDLTYPNILKLFGDHLVKGGTEARAFLAWFLEHYYRLEQVDIYDSVCDTFNDKGIDGVYINHQLRQIQFFQTTTHQSSNKTQGDSKLKTFAGAIMQFNSPENAATTLKTAAPELQAIAERVNLIDLLKQGYEVRGIFITNVVADANAISYLSTQPKIELYDQTRLVSEFVTIDKTDPIAKQVVFDITGTPKLSMALGADLNMTIAAVLAKELVMLDGISNGELFSWNVRQWLGKNTTVNKSVAESIKIKEEHKLFPAFHNGITILCKELDSTEEQISISGYAVVNGCQSITTLFENKSSISPDLKILTKFIKVEPDSALAAKITDHTNNQNGIKPRDQQSNSPIQTRLQSEVRSLYPEFNYRIKRGEHPEWAKETVIENEEIGRILLAFDLQKQEAWSQNYKLFDDLHSEIFGRPDVTAHRLVFLYETYRTLQTLLPLFEDQLFGNYTLTRWLVLYILKEALLMDDAGKRLVLDPKQFMEQTDGRNRIQSAISKIIRTIITLLNGEIKRRKETNTYFDYKKELKNRDSISALKATITTQYTVIVGNGYDDSFGVAWQKSAPKVEGTA